MFSILAGPDPAPFQGYRAAEHNMALPTSTSNVQRYSSLPLDVPAMQPFSADQSPRYSPAGNHEPNRAFSDSDIHRDASWDHRQQGYFQSSCHSIAQLDNVSSPIEYGGTSNTAGSLGPQSEVNRAAECPNTGMTPAQNHLFCPPPASLFRPATIDSTPNVQTRGYPLSRATTAPASGPTQWHPLMFRKVAYCPRYAPQSISVLHYVVLINVKMSLLAGPEMGSKRISNERSRARRPSWPRS